MFRRVSVLWARKSRPPWAKKTRREGDQFNGSGLDATVDEADPAVGGFGHLLAVCDEDDGGFFPVGQNGEQVNDRGTGGGVEVAGGFVGKKDGGAVNEGAGEGGALELAAGELVGAVMSAIRQADGVEEVAGSGFAERIGPAGEEEGEKDVFLNGEGGEEMEKLEYEADLELPEGGELVIVQGVEGVAFEVDLAGGGGVESAEDVEEGAFSATAGSGDGNDLTRLDF